MDGSHAGGQQQVRQRCFCFDKFLDCLDCIVTGLFEPCALVSYYVMRVLGPTMVVLFYYLMGYHTWIFLTVISTVLRVRVGSNFAVVWTLIGIVITYNVLWNHLLAMLVKPGSPKDLARNELLRLSIKNRKNRAEFEAVAKESGASSQPKGMAEGSERFEGISK